MSENSDIIKSMKRAVLLGKISASIITASLTYNIVMLWQAMAAGNMIGVQIHLCTSLLTFLVWLWILFG